MTLVKGDQTEGPLDCPSNLSKVCEECHEENKGHPRWSCPFDLNIRECDEFGHVGDP